MNNEESHSEHFEDPSPGNGDAGGQDREAGPSLAEDGRGAFNRPAFTAAASFALLIISLSLIFYALNLNAAINAKEEIIQKQQARIADLKNALQQKNEWMSLLSSRNLRWVTLEGLEVNPKGYGKILWSSGSQKALLQLSNLPPLPPGKSYQLWIIKNNQPLSAGTFSAVDSAGSFFKMFELAGTGKEADLAFAVTIEPSGGSAQPSGEMYLYGNAGKRE